MVKLQGTRGVGSNHFADRIIPLLEKIDAVGCFYWALEYPTFFVNWEWQEEDMYQVFDIEGQESFDKYLSYFKKCLEEQTNG